MTKIHSQHHGRGFLLVLKYTNNSLKMELRTVRKDGLTLLKIEEKVKVMILFSTHMSILERANVQHTRLI